jgi:hypothetical protein
MRWGADITVAVTAFAIGIIPVGTAYAQTPGTAGPLTFDLFTGDGVDLNSGPAQRFVAAARTAQAPPECVLGRFRINMRDGDPLFQRSIGEARRDAVLAFLNGQGITPSRFFAEVSVGGTQNNVQLDLAPRDTMAPSLDVQWTPPKGSKVKAGARITAKVVAHDDINRWQSGIKTIDLNVDGGGSFGFGDYPPPPPPCERPPPAHTLEGVHTVRTNPPPVVRLRAQAKDYAGNETEVWADFPTGDWAGSLKFSSESVVLGVKTTFNDHMDIVLNDDGRGNLEGTLVGNRTFKQNEPSCPWEITVPNKLRGKLVGSYTSSAGVMSIQFIEPVVAPAPRKNCPGGGYIYSGDSIHEAPQFKSILQSPRAAGDGIFRSSTEWTEGPVTNSFSLSLQRVPN